MSAGIRSHDISTQLERSRQELLDLSSRNRLISTPLDGTRGKRLEIVDERSEDIFRLLAVDRTTLSFLAAQEEQPSTTAGIGGGSQADARKESHTDRYLQTRLGTDQLKSRLLDLEYDARTFEEEQGVSILYLALGFLEWYEAPSSDKARYAPLVLLPVDLERTSSGGKHRLKFRDEELATNLSLQAKLAKEFQLEFPDVPDAEALDVEAYFDSVADAVRDQPRWQVHRNRIVLWFFSFAKFLMYRDLGPDAWPEHAPLLENALLKSLLVDGFSNVPPICDEATCIDDVILPEHMTHVTDADASQAIVIEEIRRGRSLVVQGPPGTGKSQTITNVIATVVRNGLSVLFVAEKMAALEVVKSRLDRLGLGPLCLELHSHKVNKKDVLAEIGRTMELGRPRTAGQSTTLAELRTARERLNQHAHVMNTVVQPCGLTPFQILGRLIRLSRDDAAPLDLPLSAACEWTPEKLTHLRNLLADLGQQISTIGPPSQCPWRGARFSTTPLPNDVKRWVLKIDDLRKQADAAIDAAGSVARHLNVQEQSAVHLQACRVLGRLAKHMLDAPLLDREHIVNPAWADKSSAIADLVKKGRDLANCRRKLAAIIKEMAWDSDWVGIRKVVAIHGRSWFRWFSSSYRAAIAEFRELLTVSLPKTHKERLDLLDEILRAQKFAKSFATDSTADKFGAAAFGTQWNGTDSDWDALSRICAWEAAGRELKLPARFREIRSRMENPLVCREPVEALTKSTGRVQELLSEIAKLLDVDLQEAFGQVEPNLIPLEVISRTCERWSENSGLLPKWAAYWIRLTTLKAEGLEDFASRVHSGEVDGGRILDQFDQAYYESLIRRVFEDNPELATFDGETFDVWVRSFRQLDSQRIALAREEVALAHYEGLPKGADVGELAIIRRELEKKRNIKPIRKLLSEAGNAVQAIKPVFMMSPISVAQFLEPGTLSFDLLVIDEASQVSPVDAFGAFARARYVTVVGDNKQLPPSAFFTKLLDEEKADDSEDDSPRDMESILGLCSAAGLPQRMLRWHYRSRHHSLIAVSNREFYDNRLFVVPSPTTNSECAGLRFRHVPDGVFDRGGTATNRIEAKAVAQAVVDHAARCPHRTLGVGAFSVAQRDAIRDELELLLAARNDLHGFFATGQSEPFFIKNLENIQGDERDVIFISVGYARDPSGFMAMSFGPLSVDGGERRLNVLISRAREQCEVFSSIRAGDIDLNRGRSRGAAAFKTFLRYAESGILDEQEQTGRDFDSEFERQVALALRGHGFEIHPQVGTAGFLIDLAVVDPKQPGRYLVGIECDGATYHSSRSARDRDRLREQVLRDRGWNIHRIWSTDWFHSFDHELSKLLTAIDLASAASESRPDAPPTSIPVGDAEQPARIERETILEPTGESGQPAWLVEYREASVLVPRGTEIHELRAEQLAEIVCAVVEAEGPVHLEEVTRRVTSLWGKERAGSRIAGAVSKAAQLAAERRKLQDRSGFLSVPTKPVAVRNRAVVTSPALRRPDMLPPDEIKEAITLIVDDSIGIAREEIVTTVARCFGFRSTSAALRQLIDSAIEGLLQAGTIAARDGRFSRGQ